MWTGIVIGVNRCQQILISNVVNQFFGFILLVFKLCRGDSAGRKVRPFRCFRWMNVVTVQRALFIWSPYNANKTHPACSDKQIGSI